MSIFPETMIDQVRDALTADDVVRRINYRPEMIQDAGATLKCFCPIHKETIFRTLLVDKAAGTYRCSNYNCPGKHGGDLIDLYARASGLSYEQALVELARDAGIELDLSAADQYLENTLEVAQNYLEMGVLAEAEEHFDRILRFKPDYLPALEAMARIYELTGRAEQFQSARLRLARVRAGRGEFDEALALLQIYVRDNPADVAARQFYIETLRGAGKLEWAAGEYVNLADDLAGRGEVDRALEMYRAAAAINAIGVDVSIHIIQLLVSAGRREEAIAEHLRQADRRLQAGDPEGALDPIEAALELDPSREDLSVRLAELIAEARLGGEPLARMAERIARLLATRAHGPAGLALDALERAFPGRTAIVSLRADLDEARGNLDNALDLRLQCIDQYHQRRQFEEALAVLERTMAGRGDNVALLSRKANLLCETGRAAEAVPVYLTIVELFRNADEHEHAAAVYQTVIDLEPDKLDHREDQFDIYLALGLEPVIVQKGLELAGIYTMRREPDMAANVLGRALLKAPASTDLLLRQGECFEEAGRRGEAAEQFLAAGRQLFDQQDFERCRQSLERSLKCVPEHLEAREALADVLTAQAMTLQAMSIYADLSEFYLREKDADSVVRIARKILNMQPEHLPTLLMLVKAYGLAGQVDKQLSTQTRLVQIYLQGQSYTRATELCEEILNSHDDYTPALEQLVAIAESTRQSTQSVRYLWKLSQVHARAGRRELEQGILEQLLARDPLHTGACFRYLELMMLWATPRALADAVAQVIERHEAAGRGDDAIQILEDLRQTAHPKPEIFAGLARLYRVKGDTEGVKAAVRIQAELLGRLLRDDEALVAWNELALLQPDDLSILRTRIEIMMRNGMNAETALEYRRLAEALVQRGRFEEAEMALLEVLNINPRDAIARDALISVFIQTREHARAAEQIDEAAGRLLEEGQFAEAIRVYERVFEFDPGRDETYRKIIAILQRMGNLEAAIEMYGRLLDCLETRGAATEFEAAAQEAIALEPEQPRVRRRLAKFYVDHQRPLEAEGVLLTLAVRQLEAGDLDGADEALGGILSLNPESVPGRAHHAELMARRGQTAEALQEYMRLTGSLAMGQVATGANGHATGNGAAFRSSNYEGIKLLKDYTFETFVVGSRNNFAYATAQAISRAPARNYNPLFLYSDVGLGKTHLCHAIAHYVIDRHPELKVLYTTTEEFVAELIDAIQSNAMTAFRARHKLSDVLIIDDVQFLSGKERAQEEFFHIFNALYQAGKQIVLTSDRPPKDISHLEKRLKSRFGAGIIVDIQSPDLETRQAILRHELNVRGKDGALAEEVLLYVAEHVESNVRDLKGALNQLLARQDFAGGRIDLVLARQVLTQNLTNV